MRVLVAYNAVFDDLGDKSKPEYLIYPQTLLKV